MEYANSTQLIQDVVLELSQFPGSGSQLYAEDNILAKLRSVFNSLCGEAWWPHLLRWTSHELDGTSGRVTLVTQFPPSLRDFGDIRAVHVDTSQKPLARLPTDFNPFALNGTAPLYVEPLPSEEDTDVGNKYLLRVWPLQSVGTLRVRARHVSPDAFKDAEVIIPFDRYTLVMGACMLYAASDGNNPGEVTAFQARYTDALTKCRIEISNMPTELDTRAPTGVTQWQEWPV